MNGPAENVLLIPAGHPERRGLDHDARAAVFGLTDTNAHDNVIVRNPTLPEDDSAVLCERAATRYRRQYASSQRYEPPRNTR